MSTSFTEIDYKNANAYADANSKIRMIQLMYKKSPHLTSWLKYEIRDATANDYFIPLGLESSSKVIKLEITKNLCEKLSCNSQKEKDVCKSYEEASYYYLGDSSYDIQCQPACFHTKSEIQTYSDKKLEESPHTMHMNFHENKCRFLNSMVISYLEKPFYRSENKYDIRVNDMPTGFTRTIDKDDVHGSGFKYSLNAAYCNYFYKNFDPKEKTCETEWWEYGVDAVIGMTLVNTVRSKIHEYQTGNTLPYPENLPKLPEKLEKKYTLNGWKSDIDKNFIIPELIPLNDDDDDDNSSRIKRSLRIKPNVYLPQTLTAGASIIVEKTTDEDVVKEIKEQLKSILAYLISEDFRWDITIDFSIDKIALFVKKQILSLIEKLSKEFIKILPFLGKIGKNVLKGAFKTTLRSITVPIMTKLITGAAKFLAKVTTAAASVIGWILIVFNIADLILTIWDPYGYKQMFPASAPQDYYKSGEFLLKEKYQKTEINFEFDNFAQLILTDAEISAIQLQTMREILYYLDALTVNSDGMRIDKGDEILFNNSNINVLGTEASNQAMVDRVAFDANYYNSYNEKFLKRIKINNFINAGVVILLSISSVFVFTKLYLLGLLLFIIAVIFLVFNLNQRDKDSLFEIKKIFKNVGIYSTTI